MLLPLAWSSNSSTSQAPRNRVAVAAMRTRNRLWCLRMASSRSTPSCTSSDTFSMPTRCQPSSGGTTTVAGSTQRRRR